MEQTTKSATVETVLGEKLDTPITFDYSFGKFAGTAEVREAGLWPNDAEIVDYVNTKAERNALSSERAKAIKDAVERIQSTTDYKRRAFVETSVKNGIPRELAEGLAAQHIQ